MMINPKTEIGKFTVPKNNNWMGKIGNAWRFNDIDSEKQEKLAITKIANGVNDIHSEKATESRLRKELKQNDLVHLTMHGFKRSPFGAFEGLVLKPDKEDDGILFAHEVGRESFEARLVFVNACETISRNIGSGEGLVGLPRELLKSGIQSVIVTRWRVWTGYSSELTPRFYEHLLAKELPADSALTLAQRELLNNPEIFAKQNRQYSYEHPYFWATYVTYGAPVPYDRSQAFLWRWIALLAIVILLVFLWSRKKKSANKNSRSD